MFACDDKRFLRSQTFKKILLRVNLLDQYLNKHACVNISPEITHVKKVFHMGDLLLVLNENK